MSNGPTYPGFHNEQYAGMSGTGKIILDARVFGLIPETESCEGWTFQRLDGLNHQVNAEWDKYGCLVSSLPPELLERHQRIYGDAIKQAKKAGWDGDVEIDKEGDV